MDKKIMFSLIAVFSLTACSTPQQRCANAGFQPGTVAFQNCALMEQQRALMGQRQGLLMMQQAGTPRQSLNCQTNYGMNASQTICQ